MDSEPNPPSDNQWIEGILQDPTKKAFLLQKLGLEDPPSLRQGTKLLDKGKTPADISGGKKGSDSTGPHLPQTLSGTFIGFGQGGMAFAPSFTSTRPEVGSAALAQFPPTQYSPVPWGNGWGCPMPFLWLSGQGPSGKTDLLELGNMAASKKRGQKGKDVFFGSEKTLYRVQEQLLFFIGQRPIKMPFQEGTANCDAVVTPNMDDEVKEQLRQKGKDAFFGSEKTLYRVQEQFLDTAGLLSCL